MMDMVGNYSLATGYKRPLILFIELPVQSAITTKVMGSSPIHGEVYSIQHNVIKFVNDLRQVSGFLRVLWFPPPIKLKTTI
jgi:hypothetical protein